MPFESVIVAVIAGLSTTCPIPDALKVTRTPLIATPEPFLTCAVTVYDATPSAKRPDVTAEATVTLETTAVVAAILSCAVDVAAAVFKLAVDTAAPMAEAATES